MVAMPLGEEGILVGFRFGLQATEYLMNGGTQQQLGFPFPGRIEDPCQ